MHRYLQRIIYWLADLVMFIVAFGMAYVIRFDLLHSFLQEKYIGIYSPHHIAQYYKIILFTLVVWTVFALHKRIYSFQERDFWSRFFQQQKTITLVFIIIITMTFVFKTTTALSRFMMVLSYVLTAIIIPIEKNILEKIVANLGFCKKKTIIISSKKHVNSILAKIDMNKFKQFNDIIGLLSNEDPVGSTVSLNGMELKVLGEISQIKTILEYANVKQSIIFLPDVPRKELMEIVRCLEGVVYQIKIIPDVAELGFAEGEIVHIGNHLMIDIKQNLKSPINLIMKRILDLFFATLIMIPFLPIFLILGIIIKIDSKGPMFFGHKRLGKGQKPFKCWKFRTMHKNAEEKLQEMFKKNPEIKKEFEKDFKLKNDPRVTRFGKILRKTSLDELPQIFNVFNGTMSLVGPRPIVEKEIEKYGKYADNFFRSTPGITGLWQVSGRNDIDYSERIMLDMYYVRNWSIGLDISILLKTIPVVLKKTGAY